MKSGSIKNAPSFEDFWNAVLQRGGWWDINAKGPDYVKPNAIEKIFLEINHFFWRRCKSEPPRNPPLL